MAIQAPQLNYFPSSQLIQNREFMNNIEIKANIYNPTMDFGFPLSGITSESQSLLPFYNSVNSVRSVWVPETFEATTTMKAESGVTCNNSASRKRSRDAFTSNPLMEFYTSRKLSRNNSSSVSFLGEDISLQIQQQQLEMDSLIIQHMEKVRLLILERRKQHTRKLINEIEQRVAKRLKEKDEEIEKAGKLNWALEERIKTVFLENQMWRNLAESKEATAIALQNNLEQILYHQANKKEEEEVVEDAESCCGSSDDIKIEGAGEEKKVYNSTTCDSGSSSSRSRWWCRKCGKKEASVVVLPCRHLCLCTLCAPTVHECPICESTKSGSVHVNMS